MSPANAAQPKGEKQTSGQRALSKVGRNDPCPCGSGKKYKKCCLPAQQSRQPAQTPPPKTPPPPRDPAPVHFFGMPAEGGSAWPGQQAPLSSGPPEAAASRPRPSLVLCCAQGLDNFVDNWIRAIEPRVAVQKVVSSNGDDFLRAIQGQQCVWIEWGNELAVWLTTQARQHLQGKRVILRIHSYEVLDRLADRIDFTAVDDLVFVAAHIRDILLSRKPEVAQQVKRIHLIPNGVDLERFTCPPKPRGFNLAFLGHLNFKKDPMILMHLFRHIHWQDRRYKLFLGGGFQEERYAHAFRHFLESNGLDQSVVLAGKVDDPAQWFQDKHYIICTSLMEGHPVGLLEAMACGCRPLIYNFPGAENMYPRAFLWNNFQEARRLLEAPYQPAAYRRFVADNYSLEIQAERIARMIEEAEEIPAREFRYTPPAVEISSSCFAAAPGQRVTALMAEARRHLQRGEMPAARTFAQRALAATRFRDPQALGLLEEINRANQDLRASESTWKNFGLAAFADGAWDDMLKAFHNCIQAGLMLPPGDRDPYQQAVDQGIHACLQGAARQMPEARTIRQAVGEHLARRRQEPAPPLKVALVLETIARHQEPVRYFHRLVSFLDRSRVEPFLFCRFPQDSPIARQQDFAGVAEEFASLGCPVVFPEGGNDWLRCGLDLALKIAGAEVDVAVAATSYFSPVLNFITRLRPAPVVGAFEFQGPEYNSSLDFCLTSEKGLMAAGARAFLTPQGIAPPPRGGGLSRGAVGIPEDAVVLVSAARAERYQSREFWVNLSRLLARHPGAWYLAIGLDPQTKARICGSLGAERVVCLDLREEMGDLLALADIYLDLFPAGTGPAMAEALAAGLPAVTFDFDPLAPFQKENETPGAAWLPPELALPRDDVSAWHATLDRLIADQDYRTQMAGLCRQRAAELFQPQAAADSFARICQEMFNGKLSA